MWAKENIDAIRFYAEESSKILPQLEEIVNFEKTIINLDQLIINDEKVLKKFARREADNFKDISNLSNCKKLHLEQKEAELLQLRNHIDELYKKIQSADRTYEMKSKEKSMIVSTSSNEQIEKDVIATFKLGTLSHFSVNRKIKFGYFLNRTTLSVEAFAFDADENYSDQHIHERWKQLKKFISKT